ncbi:unnamed protein product [Haemonchus placei]|uniref:Secreted protein n=1 Tax=Haemonchus placei TaxID=6290 RepID=A0A0N4X3M9_HAEPC|nr:unnamed protein product [Haemonchus placei]
MKFSIALVSTALAVAFAKPQWGGSAESTGKHHHKHHHRHTRSPRTAAPVFTDGTPESSDLPVGPTGIADLKYKPHHKHHHRHTRPPPSAAPETTVTATDFPVDPSHTVPVVTMAEVTVEMPGASTDASSATAEGSGSMQE